MTGRGNVLGMNAKMSRGNCKGLTKCAGKRAACCVAPPTFLNPCSPTVVTITSTMGVEFNPAGGANLVYGFVGATDAAGPTGTLLPALEPSSTFSVGDSSGTMIWQQTNPGVEGQFGILFDPAGQPPVAPDNLFVSISFTNSNGTRTYNVADATQKPSITGNNNFLWNFGGAGEPPYAPENSFWQDSSGVATAVTMTTNVIPCEPKNRACCEFPHGGQPAPQQSYRVYLNRKSKGAYRPAGGKQCKTLAGCTNAKTVWKQGSNLDASVVTTNRRDNILACNSDVYTAKRDTCTGCIDCEDGDSTLTVGYETGGFGEFWGYDNPGGLTTGNLVPNTIDGSGVRFLGFQTAGNFPNEFFVTLDTSGSPSSPQNLFNSITFANCKDKSLRTYNTANASFNPQDTTGGLGAPTWRWNAAASGYSISNETAYWSGVSGENLNVYINNTNPEVCCFQCRCCPVKKNICGCRATDLLRYTRINKSFGCQTTKVVRMGRSASEQIARRRAAVDCIKPKHRTIYLTINTSGQISFDGCCGNQCLIQGQRYSFQIKNNYNDVFFRILWCQQVPGTDIGIFDVASIPQNSTVNASFTVPTFNNKLSCKMPEKALLGITTTNSSVSLDYCKQAFKRPQMLGSCSGR